MSPDSRYARPPYAKPVDPDARDTVAGSWAWLAGLAALFGFVFVSPILSLLTTLIAFGYARAAGPRAHCNAVRAVNWQFTYFAIHALLLLVYFVVASTLDPEPLGIFRLLTFSAMVALAIINFVFAIVGAVQASRGRVFAAPGVPVLRLPRDSA